MPPIAARMSGDRGRERDERRRDPSPRRRRRSRSRSRSRDRERGASCRDDDRDRGRARDAPPRDLPPPPPLPLPPPPPLPAWHDDDGGSRRRDRDDRGGRGGGGRGRGRGRDRDRGGDGGGPPPPPPPPPDPEFGLSGALAADANDKGGVALIHAPPPDAALPPPGWRLYIFKGETLEGEPLLLKGRSATLFGRERRVADVPTDHPSCSKQHAAICFRRTTLVGDDGMDATAVRPYAIDLGSTNGTRLNGVVIEAARYHQLLPKDVLRFGHSTREYVLVRE